jgi:thiamine-monophosphate kinase
MLMSERLRERYGFTVSLTAGNAAACMEDVEGDALDAVLMCVQAAWASGQDGFGVPKGADEVEGWIVDPETWAQREKQAGKQRETEEVLLSRVYGVSRDMREKFPQVIAGPGHDCAVVRVGGADVLLKTDQVIQGRHFVAGTPVELIARKALARPISDIAAAAGMPLAALVAAALPDGDSRGKELVDAVHMWGRHWKCPVVGGDIARTSGPLTVNVIGVPATKRGAVLRSGARPGDDVWVTGELGGSFVKRTGMGRHLTFEPRLQEATELAAKLGGTLRAMMDVSDGLGRDAARLAEMSGVGVEIEASRVPRAKGVKTWKRAMSDGEDYELLFVTAPGVKLKMLSGGTKVTRIGRVVEYKAGAPRAIVLVGEGRKRIDVSTLGWEHGA